MPNKAKPAEPALSDKPKRRWYQFGFSIRDLLLVTVIVALAVGWWVDRSGLAEQNKLLRRGKRSIYTIDGPPPRWESPLPNSSAPAPNPPKK